MCFGLFRSFSTDWPDWSRALNVHWKSKRPINPTPWGRLPSNSHKSSHPDTSRPKNYIKSEVGNLWPGMFCALRPPTSLSFDHQTSIWVPNPSPSLFSFSPTLNRFSPALHRVSSSSVTSVSSAKKKKKLVFLCLFITKIAPVKMRKTEPWTKSEIHYRGWLRRRRPDKSKLQISFDARKEQLNIYKTAGKKRRLLLWFLSGESAVSPGPFFITISSLITRSDASSLDVSSKNLPEISVCGAEKYQRAHLFYCRVPAMNQLILLMLFILYQFSFLFSSETVSHKTNNLLLGCHVLEYYLETDVGNCCGIFLWSTVLQTISKTFP